MQWAGISFPIEIHGCTLKFGIDIIRLDSQRTVQNRFLLGETAQMTITERDLLQREAVARIQINCALQATHRFFLFALATLDVTLQLENSGIIRQGLGGNVQFGHSGVIIEVASIKVLSPYEVCFTRIWMEAKCRLNGRFSQCQPRRSMVVTEKIKAVVSRSEQAIRFKK